MERGGERWELSGHRAASGQTQGSRGQTGGGCRAALLRGSFGAISGDPVEIVGDRHLLLELLLLSL